MGALTTSTGMAARTLATRLLAGGSSTLRCSACAQAQLVRQQQQSLLRPQAIARTFASASAPRWAPASAAPSQSRETLSPASAEAREARAAAVAEPETIDDETVVSLIASQPGQYLSALFMGRRYLLTPGDVLTVPKLKGVKPGDTLLLTRVVELGSRDYTLRAASSVSSMSEERFESPATALRPPLSRAQDAQETPRDWQRYPDSLPALRPGAFVRAKVTVIEHTKGRMFEVEKFKKRKGYRRTLRSKLAFTRVRVGDFEFPPASGAV